MQFRASCSIDASAGRCADGSLTCFLSRGGSRAALRLGGREHRVRPFCRNTAHCSLTSVHGGELTLNAMTITNSISRISLWARLAAVLGCIVAGSYAWAGISDQVVYKKLPNGLQALVLENHKAPVATVNVFYQVGSRNETFGQTGISHLCEHLMFRGTKKYGPEEFSNIIAENGGEDNAFTSADYTDYFELINRDHLDIPLSLEADRMANFAPKGFDSEKSVVMEERRLRTDDSP